MNEVTITTKLVQKTLSPEAVNTTYSLYKFSQDGDDSRGLMTRTFTYYEYLIFCLKANPLEVYLKNHDLAKIRRSIELFMNKIPNLKNVMTEPLCIEKRLYVELEKCAEKHDISFNHLIIYNVFIMSKNRNPSFILNNPDYYKHEQRTWLHPPTEEIPLTDTERELVEINHIQRQLKKDIIQMKSLENYYMAVENGNKNVIRGLNRIENKLEAMKQNIV